MEALQGWDRLLPAAEDLSKDLQRLSTSPLAVGALGSPRLVASRPEDAKSKTFPPKRIKKRISQEKKMML